LRSLQKDDLCCGTPIFMAPEIALKKKYTKSVDIWAVGIIMHMLLTGGKHPYFIKGVDSAKSFH